MPDATATPAPHHDLAAGRFTVSGAEGEAVLDYDVADGVMRIRHTVVPKPMSGRGIAGALVRAALDLARLEGWQVRPDCSYADAWMRRHPDYDALRAA
jgi:predicted GNAT family acetyltransferase